MLIDGLPLSAIGTSAPAGKPGLTIDAKKRVEYDVEYDKDEKTITIKYPQDAFIEEGKCTSTTAWWKE